MSSASLLGAGQVQRQPQNLLLILPHQRVKGRPRPRLRLADQLHLRCPFLHPLLSALRFVHALVAVMPWQDCTFLAAGQAIPAET